MTDTNLLKDKINESGYKLAYLAKMCGITYASLLSRLKGDSEFRADEMRILAETLHLDDATRIAIFFAHDVDVTGTQEG